MAEESKTGEHLAAGETSIDYKAEYDRYKTENENLKKSNEELRLEFMSEEYLDFLNTKGTTTQTTVSKSEPKSTTEVEDEFKHLTPKQIYDRALKDAEEKINFKMTEFQQQQKAEEQARIKEEIKGFATTHPEFETYRTVMHSLSLDPKYASQNLDQLLHSAKEYVKSLAGASEDEKEKSRKSIGEKPGHSTLSFQKGGKRISADEANELAWEESIGKGGLPPAV